MHKRTTTEDEQTGADRAAIRIALGLDSAFRHARELEGSKPPWSRRGRDKAPPPGSRTIDDQEVDG